MTKRLIQKTKLSRHFGNAADESHQDSAFATDEDVSPGPRQGTSALSTFVDQPAGITTPVPSHRVAAAPVRSALKGASGTPVSALKDPNKYRDQTPITRAHRLSVSFSDGKRDGPIRGLQRNAQDEEEIARQTPESMFVPSARSKRIAAMMEAEESSGESSQILFLRPSY